MLPVFEEDGDVAGLARAWRLLWVIYGTTGVLERAQDAASRVVEIAQRSGDTRLAARAAVAFAQAALESPVPVVEAIERTQTLVDAVGLDRIAEARFLSIRSVLYAMRGEFDTARSMYRRSHELMEAVGTSVTASGTSLESSRVEMLAGDAAAAERELLRDLRTLEAMDERYYRSSVAGLLGHALYTQQRFDEAGRFTDLAQELADDDDVYSQVIWQTARAKLLAQAGRGDAAVAEARRAVLLAGSGSYLELLAEAHADLAEVFRVLSRDNEQEPPLREALALFERKGDLVSSALVRDRLGRLDGVELRS
jgi:tetratricopeptide (TPR) repeat protein